MNMKPTEFKNKTSEELAGILGDLKAKLAKLSFELEANTLKDTSQLTKTKKDVARVLTALKKLSA